MCTIIELKPTLRSTYNQLAWPGKFDILTTWKCFFKSKNKNTSNLSTHPSQALPLSEFFLPFLNKSMIALRKERDTSRQIFCPSHGESELHCKCELGLLCRARDSPGLSLRSQLHKNRSTLFHTDAHQACLLLPASRRGSAATSFSPCAVFLLGFQAPWLTSDSSPCAVASLPLLLHHFRCPRGTVVCSLLSFANLAVDLASADLPLSGTY